MDLKELIDLISIRQYVVNSVNNPTIDRAAVSELNGTLLLVDKKILGIILGNEFKEYIGYSDVRKAIIDAARVTNIRSGLKK